KLGPGSTVSEIQRRKPEFLREQVRKWLGTEAAERLRGADAREVAPGFEVRHRPAKPQAGARKLVHPVVDDVVVARLIPGKVFPAGGGGSGNDAAHRAQGMLRPSRSSSSAMSS